MLESPFRQNGPTFRATDFGRCRLPGGTSQQRCDRLALQLCRDVGKLNVFQERRCFGDFSKAISAGTNVPVMIRKPQTTGFWRGRLPHWEVEDGRYFVTIHLSGAIPKHAANRVRLLSQDLSKRNDSPTDVKAQLRLTRTIFREMERWLDRSDVNSWLGTPIIATMVEEAIQYRAKSHTWQVIRYVIMPNYVHLLLSVLQGTLKHTLEDFKRWTGHRAAELMELPNGRFWQDEWFDHWSRSDEQDERIVAYIRRNPIAAGLVDKAEDWRFGGAFL
jgi:REP-associated tyrosine transposase